MSLEQREYSVLVASAMDNFNSALSPLLAEAACSPAHVATSVSAAKIGRASCRARVFILV